jgi:hypothetical protein
MIRDAGHRGWELAWTQPHRPHRRRRAAGRSPQVCLPLWELIGAFLGILAGITFGERASPLNPLGDVYAMMLLSVVYPYILVDRRPGELEAPLAGKLARVPVAMGYGLRDDLRAVADRPSIRDRTAASHRGERSSRTISSSRLVQLVSLADD